MRRCSIITFTRVPTRFAAFLCRHIEWARGHVVRTQVARPGRVEWRALGVGPVRFVAIMHRVLYKIAFFENVLAHTNVVPHSRLRLAIECRVRSFVERSWACVCDRVVKFATSSTPTNALALSNTHGTFVVNPVLRVTEDMAVPERGLSSRWVE